MELLRTGHASSTRRAAALGAVALVVGLALTLWAALRSGEPAGTRGTAPEIERTARTARETPTATTGLADATRLEPTPRRTVPSPSSAFDDSSEAQSFDPFVTIVCRPRSDSGGTVTAVHASILAGEGRFSGWIASAPVGRGGEAILRGPRLSTFGQEREILVANSRAALSALTDGRLLFQARGVFASRVSAPEPVRTEDEAVLDLGALDLAVPGRLVTLRIAGGPLEPFQVRAGVQRNRLMFTSDLSSPLARGAARQYDGDVTEVAITTFGELLPWSVTAELVEGGRPLTRTGQPGETVDLALPRAAGVLGVVDLARHPDAAWVLFVQSGSPARANRLDRAAFDARQGDAARSLAIPLPARRTGETEYPLGHVHLDDGAYVVELWSLLDDDELRWKLTTRAVVVDGVPVPLRL